MDLHARFNVGASIFGQHEALINSNTYMLTTDVEGATSMGRAYAATQYEVAAISRLARAQGRSYGVAAIILTHGEADAGSSSYGNELFQLWNDYDTDLRSLTGQTQRLQMLTSQQHSVPNAVGARSAATQARNGARGWTTPRRSCAPGPSISAPTPPTGCT